jgi:hypothetical protein
MSSKQLAHMLIVGLIPSSVAHAAPDVLGADLVGTGGVSQAASRSNAAITTNPGLLGLHDRYDFGAQFGYGPSRGLHWGVSGMDARTAKDIALGFVYSGDRAEPPLTVDELPGWAVPGADIPNIKRQHDFTAALAGSLFDNRVSIGVGGNVSLYDHDRNGKGTTGNADVGLGLRPTDALTFGFSANNVLPIDPLGERPLQLAGGVRLDTELAAIEVDGGSIAVDSGTPAFVATGGEVRPGSARLRAGFRWEGPTDTSRITAGVGFENEGGSIEYGLEVPIGGNFASTVHVVGFRFIAPRPLSPDSY